jgi:hypothetical protein
MFSKINFTYKNPSYNQKKYMIIRQLQTQQKIRYNDSKSINNSLDLSNKIDTNKIQNIEKTFVESKELNTDENISMDNNMEIHLYDSSNINTFIIDKIQIDTNDEEEHDITIGEGVELKLYDSSNINTNMIDTIVDNSAISDIMLTDEGSFIVPFNVNRIHSRGIKIINNVYQSKYNYGMSNCTGLGDFIRGCYFILEFCLLHSSFNKQFL